jgi:hypothetical protein
LEVESIKITLLIRTSKQTFGIKMDSTKPILINSEGLERVICGAGYPGSIYQHSM